MWTYISGEAVYHKLPDFQISVWYLFSKREDVLYQMKTLLSPSRDDSAENPWILVDSGGEEVHNKIWRAQYVRGSNPATLKRLKPSHIKEVQTLPH